MIRKNAQSLKDVLDEVLKKQHLDGRLYETRLIQAFPEVVGPLIASYTKNLYIKNSILYVSIDSSVIRNEMLLMRQNLISRLNTYIGHDTIKDIVFH